MHSHSTSTKSSLLNCSSSCHFTGSNVKAKIYEIELFVVRWMDLESVIQSEVSQKDKNKYRMLTHIYGI